MYNVCIINIHTNLDLYHLFGILTTDRFFIQEKNAVLKIRNGPARPMVVVVDDGGDLN